MKLTIYYKDSIRKLKTSIFRYISIIVIIMLGVGFFVGMNSVAPDMKKTTEEYLKTSNVFDIQLASNLGYDKKDVEKFEQIEEITEVEPVYNYDVLTTINDKNLPVRFTNTKDPQYDIDQTFSGYKDFSSDRMLTDVQDELIQQITDELVDQIFNATVANW